jgi:hypothetical protein
VSHEGCGSAEQCSWSMQPKKLISDLFLSYFKPFGAPEKDCWTVERYIYLRFGLPVGGSQWNGYDLRRKTQGTFHGRRDSYREPVSTLHPSFECCFIHSNLRTDELTATFLQSTRFLKSIRNFAPFTCETGGIAGNRDNETSARCWCSLLQGLLCWAIVQHSLIQLI